MAILTTVLNFLYPPRCAGCEKMLGIEESRRLCAGCLERIEPLPGPLCETCGAPLESPSGVEARCTRCLAWPPAFRRARSLARYRAAAENEPGTLASVIRRHKYGLDQSLGRALLEYLGEEIPLPSRQYDLVLPVPLHRRRLRWRGFNQAALLGAELARRLGCRMDTSALGRVRATLPQTAQDHDERRRNVQGAFVVHYASRIAGRRLLLVDDVMTTGATVDECARVLVRAGARSVDVFTLARAL